MLDAVRAAGSPLLVLVSGGRDSVCLLDLAVRVHGVARVRALHVNYGLRSEADGDERLCSEMGARLGVDLAVVRAAGPPATGNLQAWARDLRYGEALRAARPEELIATAHTASDQAETILYRLASSPGRRALLGMTPRTGRLVRPLLSFPRAKTTAYCEERGLAWADDATNRDGRFARSRVRHDLLPALGEIHPAAEENLLRTAALLRDEAEVLDALVDAETSGQTISVERMRELHPALRRLVVQRLADRAAGALVPGAARRTEEILALGDPGALDVGRGMRALVARGTLSFGRSERRAAPA